MLALQSASLAQGGPAGNDTNDIRRELDELRSRVETQDQELRTLRQSLDQTNVNKRTAAETDKIVRAVLEDAERRSRVSGSGVTAGYDDRFFLRSVDDKFRLNIGGYLQLRYLENFRDSGDESIATRDEDELGFQIRYATLQFSGHVGSPTFTYCVQLTSNRDSASVEVEIASVGYAFTDSMKLNGGRFKGNFLLEEYDVSSTRQLAVERSLVNAIFTLNYVEGVELQLAPVDWMRACISMNDGLRSGDPGGAGNDFQNDNTDVAFTGRAEFKVMGDWTQKADFASFSGSKTALFLGAAVHYELAETGDGQTASPGVDDFYSYTVDAHFQSNGLDAFAALVGRHVTVTDTATTGDLNDFGAVVQAGYMLVPDKFAPFARYEWIGPDDDRGLNDMSLATIGANYYLRKHAAKLTVDVVWALDELNGFAFTSTPSTAPGSASRSALGLLPDSLGSRGQSVVRLQFQLMF
jgi:hypothetical protein